MASAEAPPPPPPHGEHQQPRSSSNNLPDGNYDIFIIPPHSAGSGFVYLPSLAPHMNSFIAGCCCTFIVVYLYNTFSPLVKYCAALALANGFGTVGLLVAVGIGAWAVGRMQAEWKAGPPPPSGGGSAGASYSQQNRHSTSSHGNTHSSPPRPPPQAPPQPPPQSPPRPPPQSSQPPPPRPSPAASGWEKAREETKKREEERKRAEELKKKREEAQKVREEAERAAKAKAEIEKWEQARAREKETREREARERIKREREEKAKAQAQAQAQAQQPTARSQTGTEDAYSYRPYDTPKKASSPSKTSTYKSCASSVSGVSESSYAPSHSTARTTPPPSHRGPYSTTDPNKIQIKAVYLFSDKSPLRPLSQLVSGQGPVTDGLILRIETGGLFIDDDVREVGQREWDVKAWALNLVEDGSAKNGLHLFRACTRDVDKKKYFFVLAESESWKVTAGIARLRKGSQVRSLNFSTVKETEVKAVLGTLGW
ncbi:hypothetical protein TI39_contig597g00020 [Zymoseptoria brevis]|uniref:Uncharacterized protein n=1 Tax=Zymoseptoria brevis TaxID=1047168 RepID=A0A0F4GHJ3_9PEZI|nr:hypothetical protein TI39_contig597g00020 [Zymoseptoria brevis]